MTSVSGTRPIPWGHLFIPGAFVQGPDNLFDLRISDYEEPPALHISAARRTDARFEDLTDQFVRHRVRFQPPHRPGGADDLEKVGGARRFVGHRISFLCLSDTRNDSLRPAFILRKSQCQQNRFAVSFCAVLPVLWPLRET